MAAFRKKKLPPLPENLMEMRPEVSDGAGTLNLWRELLASSKGGFLNLSTSKSYATGQELESLSFRTLLGSIYNSLMLKSLRNICYL